MTVGLREELLPQRGQTRRVGAPPISTPGWLQIGIECGVKPASFGPLWVKSATDIRKHASELAALTPDVILAHGAATLAPLLQVTRTVPIVFAAVTDPVVAGFVDSLARPSGNATGFMNFEYGIASKWLALLKEIAPGVSRVATPRDPTQGGSTAMLAALQATAQPLKVEINPINMRDADEIERAIAAFARTPNGGLIVAAGGRTLLHRELIIALATRHKLPAVYSKI